MHNMFTRRKTRITKSLNGQLDEFLTHLRESPNVRDLKIVSGIPLNPPSTVKLMVDTFTSNGGTKRLILCIDIDGDREIKDINARCDDGRYTNVYDLYMPSLVGGANPVLARQINSENQQRLVEDAQEQIRTNVNVKRDGFNRGKNKIIYPLVGKLGLAPQEILDLLEPDFCQMLEPYGCYF